LYFGGGGAQDSNFNIYAFNDSWVSSNGVDWAPSGGNLPQLTDCKFYSVNDTYTVRWGGFPILETYSTWTDTNIYATTDGVNWKQTNSFPTVSVNAPPNKVMPYSNGFANINGTIRMFLGGGQSAGSVSNQDFSEYTLEPVQKIVDTTDFSSFQSTAASCPTCSVLWGAGGGAFTSPTVSGGGYLNGKYYYVGLYDAQYLSDDDANTYLVKTWASDDGVTWYDTNIPAPFNLTNHITYQGQPKVRLSGKMWGGYQVFNGELHLWGGGDLDQPIAHREHYAFNGTSWRTVCGNDCPYGDNRHFNWVVFRNRLLMVKSIPAFFYDVTIAEYPNATTTVWAYGEADDCLLEGYPCLNQGTCVDGYLTYTCSCLPGYSGLLCQTDINECLSSPCQHGGTCTDLVNNYHCACIPGYSGNNCQSDTNECSSSPCQNGGTCTDLVNGYNCACIPGTSGINCQTDINECASSPCQNGQLCFDQKNSFVCLSSAWHATAALVSFIPLVFVLLL